MNFFDVFKARQCGSVADDVGNLVDSGVEFGAIDELVKRVSVIITGGEIDGGNTKFGSD